MEKQLEAFFSNVKNRFNNSAVSEISEDCIRYDFFIAFSASIKTQNIILEYPHPDNTKKKVDCVIKHDKNIIEAIEFKFFRPIPSNKSTPQTQLLGQMVKDIYKLIGFKTAGIKKIIIVADSKMKNYMDNQLKIFENSNGKDDIIKITKNDLNKKGKIFQKNIEPYKNRDISLKRIFCKEIEKEDDKYIVGVFEII
jgi:hypothetical protein